MHVCSATIIVYLGMMVESVARAFSKDQVSRERASYRSKVRLFEINSEVDGKEYFVFACFFWGQAFYQVDGRFDCRASTGSKPALEICTTKARKSTNFRVSWMIRTVLSLGGMKGMWCSPSLQMLRLTAGWLLSTSSLLISRSATPRMLSLGTSYSKKCIRLLQRLNLSHWKVNIVGWTFMLIVKLLFTLAMARVRALGSLHQWQNVYQILLRGGTSL